MVCITTKNIQFYAFQYLIAHYYRNDNYRGRTQVITTDLKSINNAIQVSVLIIYFYSLLFCSNVQQYLIHKYVSFHRYVVSSKYTAAYD